MAMIKTEIGGMFDKGEVQIAVGRDSGFFPCNLLSLSIVVFLNGLRGWPVEYLRAVALAPCCPPSPLEAKPSVPCSVVAGFFAFEAIRTFSPQETLVGRTQLSRLGIVHRHSLCHAQSPEVPLGNTSFQAVSIPGEENVFFGTFETRTLTSKALPFLVLS